MADTNQNQNDSLRRFTEARERYQSSLASQPETMSSDNFTLPSGMKPIPVKLVDATSIMGSKAIDSLNKTVKASAVPIPLKIDDSNISSEHTLQLATQYLSSIDKNIVGLDSDFTKEIGKLDNTLQEGLLNIVEEDNSQKGWIARLTGGFLSYFRDVTPKMESISESISKFIKPVMDSGANQINRLDRLIGIQLDVLAANRLSMSQAARDQLDEQKKKEEAEKAPKGKIDSLYSSLMKSFKNSFKGLSTTLFPEDSTMRSGINFIKGAAGFMVSIGKFGDSIIKNSKVWPVLVKSGEILSKLPVIGRIVPLFAKFASAIGGLAGFLTAIAATAIIAPIYAVFRNPDQLAGYLSAFGTLFSENIAPTLAYITTNVVPVLSVIFAGLVYVVDKFLDTIGTFINGVLINILGEQLPKVFTTLGRTFKSLWEGLVDIGLRIAGIFGVGEYAGEGFFKNILGAFISFGDGILDALSQAFTGILGLFVNLDFLGLNEGESIYGRLKRFIMVDVPNKISVVFNTIANYIESLDPIQMMKDKIYNFINTIANIIPSWDDLKGMMRDAIPSWIPESTRNWLESKLTPSGASEEPTVLPTITVPSTPDPEPASSSWYDRLLGRSSEVYDKASDKVENLLKDNQDKIDSLISVYDRAKQTAIVYAPTVDNSTVSNISNRASGYRDAAIGHTRMLVDPLSEMLNRAIPY